MYFIFEDYEVIYFTYLNILLNTFTPKLEKRKYNRTRQFNIKNHHLFNVSREKKEGIWYFMEILAKV